MTLAEKLNEKKIKPVVVGGGKVRLYVSGPDQKPYSDEGSVKIEEESGVSDTYIIQNPQSTDKNNLVVCAYGSDDAAYFDKTAQKWVVTT